MGPIRKQQRHLRRALTRHILAEDPHANWRTVWSDLGYALERWHEKRVEAAVLSSHGRNAMGQALAALLRQPKLLHLKKRAA